MIIDKGVSAGDVVTIKCALSRRAGIVPKGS